MDGFNLAGILTTAMEDARARVGHVNVLIAGRTGVGKSTLINSVFNSELATTGQGKPVTQTTRLIQKEGVPLRIWDTRGLEMADFSETLDSLIEVIREQSRSEEIHDHIHCGWLCIAEPGRRVERAEQDLCRALAEHMPVVGVITKASADRGFGAEVQQMLPETRNVVRVRAIDEKLDDGHTVPKTGLEELVELTADSIPDGVRDAAAAAQKISIQLKIKQARITIGTASASAAAAAAVPVPFADAAILIPIQVGMLARISVVFGLDTSRAWLSVLAGTAMGTTGATMAGRTVMANLLKLVPGAGWVAGSAIGAATAATLTTALGEMYIASIAALMDRTPEPVPDPDAVKAEFERQIRSATRGPWWKRLWPKA